HNYEKFADQEIELRRGPAYPPNVGLVNVILSSESPTAVSDAAVSIADWLRALIAARAEGKVEVVGPAPAPLERIKNRWRWPLLLRSTDPVWLGRIIRYAAARWPQIVPGRSIRVVFDRD